MPLLWKLFWSLPSVSCLLVFFAPKTTDAGEEHPGGSSRAILSLGPRFEMSVFCALGIFLKQTAKKELPWLSTSFVEQKGHSSGKKKNPNPNFLVRISSGGVELFHVKPGKPNFLA